MDLVKDVEDFKKWAEDRGIDLFSLLSNIESIVFSNSYKMTEELAEEIALNDMEFFRK